ncbi:MAG TPA: DUF547 domain-containing protein, partial [Candidatus Krumholzibacteria bacterium]|nr:DUF547 domain-containing protein [Candidatus Krumholzibacteria bacterium]
ASLLAQRDDLDDFVHALAQVNPKDYASWSQANQIAFWINAYNALTLRAIIDHYPIRPDAGFNAMYPANSIRQIKGVWDVMRVNVMGESITLQYIETQHLRHAFHEPRIHMALVCAAMSCPKLRAEPYTGARLEAQLDEQVRTFLANPRNFRIDRAAKVVHASEIFHWYTDDFRTPEGPAGDRGWTPFVAPYLGAADRAFLESGDYRIEYTPYDWLLNEQPH